MRFKAIHALVLSVCMAGLVGIGSLDLSPLVLLSPRDLLGLGALVCLGLLAEYLALTIDVSKNKGASTITFLPCLTTLLVFGPAAGTLFMTVVGAIGEFGFRRKPVLKATFNTAQYALSMLIAGWAFGWAGGIPQFTQASFQLQLLPFAIGAIGFLGSNQVFVSLAITLSQGQPFQRVFRRLVSKSGTNLLYDWLVSPIAIGLAYLYTVVWVPGLLVSFLPLLFVRHSYLTNLALQRTNRALLKALVKAIETRDPYTSGHSLRVAALSARIAQTMGVVGAKLESIETAALLHDIGKIEAIYTEILKKPGHLSEEEREIIESHVTKGVELLTSLGSFPREVIDSVRHHHEREDGRGYPDGISGNAIPLGARIIKVVDAVDAMLSDRPYRSALSIPQVKEQLSMYQGSQFNGAIVKIVLETNLLEEHAATLKEASRRLAQDASQLDDWQHLPTAGAHHAEAEVT